MKCFISYASDWKDPTSESNFIEINNLDELRDLPERFIRPDNGYSFDFEGCKKGYELVLKFDYPIYNNHGKIIGKCLYVQIRDFYLD